MARSLTSRRAGLATLLGASTLLLSGCSADEVVRFGWPEGVTPQAERMRELWSWSVIAALIVGVLVWGLIFWTTTFHRKKVGAAEFPRQTQYNLPLEIIYTVIPFLMVAVLFYFTIITQQYVNEQVDDPDVTVEVTAFQWNWEFGYAGTQAADGEPVSTVGSSEEIPLLVVPAGRIIQFELTSRDVIHSFFVPEFLFKRDVFPQPDRNDTDNVFQVGPIDREGAFVGRCAELCGTYHSMMSFELRAVSPEVYADYIALREETNPVTGAPYTTSDALTELDCGELCAPEATTTTPFNTDRTARQATVAGGN